MSQDSGAWLRVSPAAATAESAGATVLPVPRQACLGLARAVLTGSDDAVRWRALCGADPAVCAWLAGVEPNRADQAGRAVRPAVGADSSLLARLARDLVVGRRPDERSLAGPGVEPSHEAMLLVEAVERMLAYARVTDDFARALEAARLEAARELAYGAGHEINNPLANIATRAQALLLQERDVERRRRLATIVDQAFRARDMIGGLMLFARPPKPSAEPVEVVDLLRAAAEAIQPAASARNARVTVESAPESLVVHVDRSQMEEALRAIATNAVEAVGVGGVVRIAARPVAAGDRLCEVSVSDNGAGMDEATVRRAFDPFFSGREAGRGAGLGLSKAWRFVEAAAGSVAIESKPGAGTTVVVTLPLAAVRVCLDSPV